MERETRAARDRMFAPVPERDFLTGHNAVVEYHETHGGERSMERTLGILCNHFPRKTGKPTQIVMRMQALQPIFDHPLMRAWKVDGLPEGGVLMEETVLRVAARHPVTVTEREWLFEPEAFFAEVLRRARQAGSS